MTRPTLLALALAAWALLTPQAPAAGEAGERTTVRVELRVSSRAGDEVWLDAGSEQGLEPGDRVRLLPTGGAPVEAVVLSVSADGARARLEGPAPGLDVDTPGEARVPAERLRSDDTQEPPAGQAQGQGQQQETPEHPGWSAPPEEWSDELPLLAPPQTVKPSEREVSWRGFAFLDGQATFDDGREYMLGRAGVDVEATNLFGQGGRLQLDVEGYARSARFDDAADEDDSRARIDRLSYLWGGDREHAASLEGGRFLQRLMPEFGVIDGLEWTQRLDSGDRIGASVGFLPEWTPEMETGDDAQVSAAWRHLAGSQDELELGLGFQKTWHEGEADRDLAVGTLSWRPDATWNVYGSAWVDFYDSEDELKSSSVEVTQATVDVSKRFGSEGGLTLFGTRNLYPELKRYEFTPVEPTTLDDFENTRFGLRAWREVARKVRLKGRVSFWMDDADDGLTGELGLAVRDRIVPQGALELTAFAGDGKYSEVVGARLEASRGFASGWWRLGWESALHTQDDFVGEQEELWQHVVRASYDRDLGADWDVSLWGDQRFGDEQQATTVGLSLRRRF